MGLGLIAAGGRRLYRSWRTILCRVLLGLTDRTVKCIETPVKRKLPRESCWSWSFYKLGRPLIVVSSKNMSESRSNRLFLWLAGVSACGSTVSLFHPSTSMYGLTQVTTHDVASVSSTRHLLRASHLPAGDPVLVSGHVSGKPAESWKITTSG